MVSRYHDGADTGFFAHFNGFFGFRTGRVYHSHQAHENKIVFQVFAGQSLRNGVNLLIRHGQNAQRLVGHFLVDFLGGFKVAGNAPAGKHVERAFYYYDFFAVYIANDAHQLAVGVKRNAAKTRIFCL